mmetsp:Transcript_604/g.1083  ORF Transcript_604/g.1083 Transcript_604/m.1083 type:complete len:203 (-) Transcript_604:29-637(-)
MVEESVTIVTPSESNGAFYGDGVTIHFTLVAVFSAIQQRHSHLCSRVRAFLSNQLLQVAGAMGPTGVGTKTDLNGRQYSRFSAPVRAVDEVHILAQIYRQFTMTHEILHINSFDNACFRGFAGGIDIPCHTMSDSLLSLSATFVVLGFFLLATAPPLVFCITSFCLSISCYRPLSRHGACRCVVARLLRGIEGYEDGRGGVA